MRESIDRRVEPDERASLMVAFLTCLCIAALLATPAWSHPPDADHTHMAQQDSGTKHGSLGEIGNKLSNPMANIWAMSTSFQALEFFDGDVSARNPQLGSSVNLQPVLPFPVYGTGEDQWKVITRPVIPIVFSQPIPKEEELNRFRHRGGIGDIQLPFLLNPSAGLIGKNMILGAGPVFEFPSSTSTLLGNEQFSVGPAVVVGYKTKTVTAVLFPNYFFGFADRSDRKDSTRTTSKLSVLYALNIALPNAWQVGFNPTISYNDKALGRNKWTVPVGLYGGKTIKVGKMPVNIKLGLEYNVVSPDSYGKRAQIRLQVTPVIPGLVSSPIFGGAK